MAEQNTALVLRDGWSFLPRAVEGQTEYWVSGTALAEKLGRDPRQVRRTVRDLQAEGEIAEVYWRVESARQSAGPSGNGERSYTFDECYLSEEDAYLVIMRVRSDVAKSLRREFARAIKALRRGELGRQAADAMIRIAPESCELIGEAVERRLGSRLSAIQENQDRHSAKLDDLGQRVTRLEESNLRQLDAKRKNPTKLTIEEHVSQARHAGGKCPCCGDSDLFDGVRFAGHIDHNFKVSDASLGSTWPVCAACNEKLKEPGFRGERQAEFQSYQHRLVARENARNHAQMALFGKRGK